MDACQGHAATGPPTGGAAPQGRSAAVLQTAARMPRTFTRWGRLDPGRRRVIGYRVRAWLAVALVAAVVVLVPVVSDVAAGPRLGVSQRPVVTTVVTVSAPADPRATEGPALQDRHRVLSW